jgi:hypothetical protein
MGRPASDVLVADPAGQVSLGGQDESHCAFGDASVMQATAVGQRNPRTGVGKQLLHAGAEALLGGECSHRGGACRPGGVRQTIEGAADEFGGQSIAGSDRDRECGPTRRCRGR